jgi:hypothetical protein
LSQTAPMNLFEVPSRIPVAEDKEFNRVSAYPQAFPTGGMTGLNGAWARGAASSSQGDCEVFSGFQGVAQTRPSCQDSTLTRDILPTWIQHALSDCPIGS